MAFSGSLFFLYLEDGSLLLIMCAKGNVQGFPTVSAIIGFFYVDLDWNTPFFCRFCSVSSDESFPPLKQRSIDLLSKPDC